VPGGADQAAVRKSACRVKHGGRLAGSSTAGDMTVVTRDRAGDVDASRVVGARLRLPFCTPIFIIRTINSRERDDMFSIEQSALVRLGLSSLSVILRWTMYGRDSLDHPTLSLLIVVVIQAEPPWGTLVHS
jgi:hypothetical protein